MTLHTSRTNPITRPLTTLALTILMLTTTLATIPVGARVSDLHLLYPRGGETIIGTIDITFTVTTEPGAPGNKIAVSYSAYEAAGPWILITELDDLDDHAPTYTVPWTTTPLHDGATYQLQIAAIYPDNKTIYLSTTSSDFTIAHQDTNLPPDMPKPLAPTDAQTDVPTNTTLTWFCTDPNVGDTLTYTLSFGATAPPPVIQKQTTTSYTPPALLYGTTYYWQITATDAANASTTGPIWSFTTHPNKPPLQPDAPTPADNTAHTNTDLTFAWAATDTR